jgi:hypothetical protein
MPSSVPSRRTLLQLDSRKKERALRRPTRYRYVPRSVISVWLSRLDVTGPSSKFLAIGCLSREQRDRSREIEAISNTESQQSTHTLRAQQAFDMSTDAEPSKSLLSRLNGWGSKSLPAVHLPILPLTTDTPIQHLPSHP